MNLLELKSVVESVVGFEFINASQAREYVDARRIFCRLARMEGHRLIHIGEFVGRDHSTVIHAVDSCKTLREVDKHFRAMYERCLQALEMRN